LAKLRKVEQDQMMVDLDLRTMQGDEYAGVYDRLGTERQMQADEEVRNFADVAVGSDTWTSED